jgi:surfeit locus 1 family protein
MMSLNMTDSRKMNADYAPLRAAAPRPAAATGGGRRRFRPRLWPTLAAALLIPLFLAAGQWQWNKASLKSERQRELESRAAQAPLPLPATRADAQALLYRTLLARGHYETQHQVLIDNQVYQQQAGYHVITPLRIDGSEVRVLVNRGWVPAPADHRQLPNIATPDGAVEIYGTATVPGTRFFTLGPEGSPREEATQRVWQNLDLARYAQAVPFPLQPVVIQLDAQSGGGGFVRDWRRPDDRLQTNLNYAIQWWSFAATTLVLWLVLNFRRPSS